MKLFRFAPHALVAAIAMGASTGANACPSCSAVNSYGSDVQAGLQNAIQTTNDTAVNLAASYAGTTSQLLKTGDQIVSAVNAGAVTISLELQRSSEAQAQLLSAVQASLEQLERSAMIAERNHEIAQTHGAENIPSELCNAFSRTEARAQAEAVAAEIVGEHQMWQRQERANEDRVPRANPAELSAVSLSADSYTETEAAMAMEMASMLTGETSFPVSPDVVATLASQPGSSTAQTQQVQTAWLRTSSASIDLSNQLAKRIIPDSDDEGQSSGVSVFGDLWASVSEGVHADTAIADGTKTQTALLRSVARRGAVSNQIRYEQLEAALVRNRLASSQLGYMNELAMHNLRDFFASEVGGRGVRGN